MAEKKKRKSLMAVLSEYQTEKGYGPKTKGKGPVKSGEEYGRTLQQNKKEDASGPKVLAPKKREEKQEEKKTDPPKTPTTPTRYRQQASTTRDNRNRGMTGYGYTGGRGGSIRDKKK